MPYSTEDKTPIQHDLFDRFLQHKEGAGKIPSIYITAG
jgi:hypothetical protein